jgi:hypothetical protein
MIELGTPVPTEDKMRSDHRSPQGGPDPERVDTVSAVTTRRRARFGTPRQIFRRDQPRTASQAGDLARLHVQGAHHKVSGTFQARLAFGVFCVVTLWPVLRRLSRPTILNDDLMRVVNLIERPLRHLLFWTFNEHVTPLFDLVTWTTWQVIRHDLRLAPAGFTVASVLPWVIVLCLLGYWLVRETGSRTASFIAVALVAQSPLILETVWWYSASSFNWAIIGILLAIIGAVRIHEKPKRSLMLVGVGSALGPAGTSLGYLAMPLAILRGLAEPGWSWRRKCLLIAAAGAGVVAYTAACRWGGSDVISIAAQKNKQTIEVLAGLKYAFCVPGWILGPAAVGVPASWCAEVFRTWVGWGAGIAVLITLVAHASWPRASWNRRVVIVGAAMIYSSYALAYVARSGLALQGRVSEAELIYRFASRYHTLPMLGLASVFASVLSSRRLMRRCDARDGLPAILGAIVGLVMFAMQHHEVETHWAPMLHHPDQKMTMSALHHLGKVAREVGISRTQLDRIITPAVRTWNSGLRTHRSEYFSFMRLIEVPETAVHPRSDADVRGLLRARLTAAERLALGSGACPYLRPAAPGPGARTVAVAKRIELHSMLESGAGRYRSDGIPGSIKIEFPRSEARYLELPGLAADQELVIFRCDPQGRWRPGPNFHWVQPRGHDSNAVVDLDGLIHWWGEPLTEIAIQLTRTGEVSLQGPPRLLR